MLPNSGPFPFPLIPFRQQFDPAEVFDVYGETRAQIEASGVLFPAGGRIAIAVGSRGIASLPEIVRATVDSVRAAGAHPFIIPAMGSHGGATAEGQAAVLAGYRVDEASMGCAIVSSLDVIALDKGVFLSCDAYAADGIVVINRIKPHTDFHGPVESGLMKMLVIGLGKHAQTLEMHRLGVPGLRDKIPEVARRVLATGKILLGVGVIENAYDRICRVAACPGAAIPETDASLLALAREKQATLPLDALDLLIVDEMGKDISGTGMDTNVIGRMRISGQQEPVSPRIRMIAVDRLTPASHGNALGIGLADVITQRLFDAIDLRATTENVVTSGFLERGRIPVIASDLPEAVRWALRAMPDVTPATVRAARIPSTLRLMEIALSPAAMRATQAEQNHKTM